MLCRLAVIDRYRMLETAKIIVKAMQEEVELACLEEFLVCVCCWIKPPLVSPWRRDCYHFAVTDWLGKHPRFHAHFTPTSASWLNMVERFFRDITTERLRRGVFTSVSERTVTIHEYVAYYNENPQPFIWTAKANDILQKVVRVNSRLSSKQNEALD